MSWELHFQRHSSIPESHIQIRKLKNDQVDVVAMKHAGVRRPSLAQEVKEGILARSTSPTNPDNISNMEKGTTFAARARAAELNSMRAAKASAAATDAIVRSHEADEVPDIPAVSLGSLKFTLHKRRNSAKASRSHSQGAGLNTPSPEPELATLGDGSISGPPNALFESRPVPDLIKALQSVTLSGQGTSLNQQAIRQKVREVSARQQSIHNVSEDEKHSQVLPNSASVSPYSSSESRLVQTQGAKKAELNTQHIREIRREAEKQRDLAQSRIQTHCMSSQNTLVDESQRLEAGHTGSPVSHHLGATQDSSQHISPKVDESNSNMSFPGLKRPDGPSSSGLSTYGDYSSPHQASFNLPGSAIPLDHQQPRSNIVFQRAPSNISIEDTTGSQKNSSLVGTSKSSSNNTPDPSTFTTSAQLLATSPAFVPSNVGMEINHPPRQPRNPFPSVKGTERRQRSKHHNQLPYYAPGTWDQSKGRLEVISTNSNTKMVDGPPAQKFSEDVASSQQKLHSSTSNTPQKIILRDPMPYTGFSKKDQLYEQLQKTINESAAKGDLPASNRSVLFDPMATTTRNGTKHNSTSITTTTSKTTPLIASSHGNTTEVSRFLFPQRSTLNAEFSDYDPDLLKDSDPLYPCVPPKKIETKDLSSPEEGYGYREQTRLNSMTAPAIPPGLSSKPNRFQEAAISNDDGFWNDSLAANSRNAPIEHSVEQMAALATRSGIDLRSLKKGGLQTVNPKKVTWIEEQKRLLRPKSPLTQAELDEEACQWFDSGKGVLEDHVKSLFHRSEGYLPSAGATFLENSKPEYLHRLSSSRHAPIGSERPQTLFSAQASTSTNPTKAAVSGEEIRKRAAIDVMANVLSNLASYHGGENPGPTQHYSQPPAWCIDHTDAGRRSFFNDNWGDVPKRVGRDPRYQKTVHEGRTTYFEDPNSAGRRDLPTYKVTPGWGAPR